jgi:murein lipoprotein
MPRVLLCAVFAAALLTTGCASTSDFKALQDQVTTLQADVSRAQTTADQASQDASDARRMAEAAQTQTMQTDEKIDRMFKKSMYK